MLILKQIKTDACSEVIDGKPVIFYDKTLKSACRIRFSLAHELGHIILHNYITAEDIKDKNILYRIEKEANTFASCFLLPDKAFISDVNSTSLDYFLYLKERWKVSISALIYRCRDLGLIDENQNLALRKKISYRHWNKIEPLDNVIPYDTPQLFRQAIDFIVNHSNTRKYDIVNYFCFNISDLSEIVGCKKEYWEDTDEPVLFSMIK